MCRRTPGGSTRWAGLSGANSLFGVVARHPSGLMGAEEAPHDPDTGATGDPRMRFEEARGGWQERRLTREEAARGGCERTFRRYEDEGLDGLVDKRSGAKSRRPPAVPSSVERQVEEEPSLSGPSAPGRPGTEGRARGGRPPLAREPATVRSGDAGAPGRCGRRLPVCGNSSPGLSEKPPIHCQSMSYTKTYTLSVGQRPISQRSGRTSPDADILVNSII